MKNVCTGLETVKTTVFGNATSFKHVRNPCDIAAASRIKNRTWFTRATSLARQTSRAKHEVCTWTNQSSIFVYIWHGGIKWDKFGDLLKTSDPQKTQSAWVYRKLRPWNEVTGFHKVIPVTTCKQLWGDPGDYETSLNELFLVLLDIPKEDDILKWTVCKIETN